MTPCIQSDATYETLYTQLKTAIHTNCAAATMNRNKTRLLRWPCDKVAADALTLESGSSTYFSERSCCQFRPSGELS